MKELMKKPGVAAMNRHERLAEYGPHAAKMWANLTVEEREEFRVRAEARNSGSSDILEKRRYVSNVRYAACLTWCLDLEMTVLVTISLLSLRTWKGPWTQ